MALYKGIDVDNGLRPLLPHMPLVEEYRESLQTLQAVWDNLNLLGQMSGTTKEMTRTRESFANLTNSLLNNLARRTLARQIQDISGKAQVAIDILVRNLFERTADIGFLAIDQPVRHYAGQAARGEADDPATMTGRFRDYVAKYSVYRDVILLSPRGEVLARLDHRRNIPVSQAPFLQEALNTDAPFVESYAPLDLFPGEPPVLIYAYRVQDPVSGPLGVLCLCFDFPDEMRRIFSDLARAGDWSVITLLDAEQQVIASSDPYLVPVGAAFSVPPGDGHILRFAGRSYLASRRATQGYQGYFGPGWSALVLVPLEHAFALEEEHLDQQAEIPRELFAAVLRDGKVFPPELQDIPRQAEAIQQELERSVWNGNVRQSAASNASLNPAFSKILLWEISRTGLRMKDVFARSIGNLQTTVVSSLLDDCRFLASLAIDIMDRNLYERANDCRWWALDPVLANLLGQPTADRQAALGTRLAGINDLYTVYDNLVLFDSQRRIVAVSRPPPERTDRRHHRRALGRGRPATDRPPALRRLRLRPDPRSMAAGPATSTAPPCSATAAAPSAASASSSTAPRNSPPCSGMPCPNRRRPPSASSSMTPAGSSPHPPRTSPPGKPWTCPSTCSRQRPKATANPAWSTWGAR